LRLRKVHSEGVSDARDGLTVNLALVGKIGYIQYMCKNTSTRKAIRENFDIGANPPLEVNDTSRERLDRAIPSKKARELGARVAALRVSVKTATSAVELDINAATMTKRSIESYMVASSPGRVTINGWKVKEQKEQTLLADLAVRMKKLASRVLSRNSSIGIPQVVAPPAKAEIVQLAEEADELARLLAKSSSKHSYQNPMHATKGR